MARAVGGEQGSKRFPERSTPSSADVLADAGKDSTALPRLEKSGTRRHHCRSRGGEGTGWSRAEKGRAALPDTADHQGRRFPTSASPPATSGLRHAGAAHARDPGDRKEKRARLKDNILTSA